MKKLYALFLVCSLSLTGLAQRSNLVGTWQLIDANGFPTTSVKVFMPDGKVLGLSFSRDFSNSSVWYMANYEVLSDSTYMEHLLYHSEIFYQCDGYFNYQQLNDSMRVTTYSTYLPNGRLMQSEGKWKKMDRPLPTFTEAEWQALYQKSLAEFDRLPKEGQTVAQYGQELYNKFQSYKKANKIDRAVESLLIRAELDTNNSDWQLDVLNFYLENHYSPSIAERIADRYIRLTEAKSPVANDTSVVNAYRMKAYLYNYRGNPAMPEMRSIISKAIEMETAAGHQPTKDYGLDYFMMAMSYLPEGNMAKLYEYAMKSIDIFKKAADVSDNQKAEAYMMAGVALVQDEQHPRENEGIDLLKKAESLFNGDLAFKITSMVYPFMFQGYENLLEKNPKDKMLKTEVEQFMADKLMYSVFEATDKEHNLWGEYIVLEKGKWTLENPACIDNGFTHYLLQKDDKYLEVKVKEDEKLTGVIHIRPVDAAMKQNIIKQWKAYKKGKK